ncbi:MAG: hypothetical protein PHW82_05065 [Bacteroidales bacterium]|nr:hypothetical protein [Bacteroidales bacterium]
MCKISYLCKIIIFNSMQELIKYGVIPLSYQTIASNFPNHKYPKNKIANLEKKGILIRLKKGLYIVSPKITNLPISKELIANHLYGPSYISMETALWLHGLIPERVYNTYSVTLKRKKEYNTKFGSFQYISVPDKYFSIGITQVIIEDTYAYLLASPEKALCDIISTKSGVKFQSIKSVKEFLIEDLRFNIDGIIRWNLNIIEDCSKVGYKKNDINLLYKYIKDECNI